jgi:hypothetical protein
MSTAQGWLIVGGLFNLFFSTLAAFSLYWTRMRDPSKPAPHYGVITHTSSVTNGLLLLALSVAIDHTNFTPAINTGLSVAEIVATLLSSGRNLWAWHEGLSDGFAQVATWRLRLRGLGDTIHLVVISAIFYGVARTLLGL